MTSTANQIYRNWEVDGVPSSGEHEPVKAEIRAWGTWLESFIAAIGVNSGSVYTSRSLLFANLIPAENSMAWVIQDATQEYNGIYQKVGTSGFGSWSRVGDLPYSFVNASDAGDGTANAIQATSSVPISASALIVMNVFEANTSSPVTVSFNGGAALTIKTNTGNDIVAGGLVPNMLLFGLISGSTFRLISDQVSSAIVAAAEAAAAEAAGYAAAALNNFSIVRYSGDGATTAFALSGVTPGAANNTFVFVDGVYQQKNTYTVVGTTLTFSEAPPVGVNNVEIGFGSSVSIGTPSDGTVTATKLEASLYSALTSYRNVLLNPRFKVNVFGQATSITLAAGGFWFCGWKGGASGCTLSLSGGVVTITAGALVQVVDGADLDTDTYTINWTGTSACTVDGVSRAKLATFGLTAGTNCTVQFGVGTLSLPQLERGSLATPFEYIPKILEDARCASRESRIIVAGGGYQPVASCTWYTPISFTKKRATPTFAVLTTISSASVATASVGGISPETAYLALVGVSSGAANVSYVVEYVVSARL